MQNFATAKFIVVRVTDAENWSYNWLQCSSACSHCNGLAFLNAASFRSDQDDDNALDPKTHPLLHTNIRDDEDGGSEEELLKMKKI